MSRIRDTWQALPPKTKVVLILVALGLATGQQVDYKEVLTQVLSSQ